MLDAKLKGIHHITAIASDAQKNVDFYVGVLGLRLIKQTVNFDDPKSYHLYYGDELGHPGTLVTFFAWPDAPHGRKGTGEITTIAFSIQPSSLEYWQQRLVDKGISWSEQPQRFGDRVVALSDPDGISIELITSTLTNHNPGQYYTSSVPIEHAIRGLHAPTLSVHERNTSEQLLTEVMGFHALGIEQNRYRFSIDAEKPDTYVDLVQPESISHGLQAVGTIHHIAWRVAEMSEQRTWRDILSAQRIGVTDVRDRRYFQSIYYREPSTILYEIATDGPGFTVDESPEELGTHLQLPPWFESQRSTITHSLPPLQLHHG